MSTSKASTRRARPTAESRKARFVTGSIPRHVMLMTLMGAIGLMSIFLVDLADLWFISMLNRVESTAGLGYAGTLAFTNLSIVMGISIAAGALVSIHMGRKLRVRARKYATSSLAVAMGTALVLTLVMELFPHAVLGLMGAKGAALHEATVYLRIVALGFPLLAGAILFSFTLRAVGDPMRSMYVTLTVAVTNAVLDPVFIFGLGMGIAGAATATVTANILSFLAGWHAMSRRHGMMSNPSRAQLKRDAGGIARIAIPVTLTQLATPALVAYFMYAASRFGDQTVAAATIINRLVPVFFGVVFSLSSAVGPIIGQNFGARQMRRVRQTYLTGLGFAAVYTLIMAAILFIFRDRVPGWFSASGEAAALIVYFCTFLSWSWIFTSGQFVSQAAFNNLGKERWSTLFNWARAIFGTMIPVEIAARYMGAKGVFAGSAAGSALIGLLAVLAAWSLIHRLARQEAA